MGSLRRTHPGPDTSLLASFSLLHGVRCHPAHSASCEIVAILREPPSTASGPPPPSAPCPPRSTTPTPFAHLRLPFARVSLARCTSRATGQESNRSHPPCQGGPLVGASLVPAGVPLLPRCRGRPRRRAARRRRGPGPRWRPGAGSPPIPSTPSPRLFPVLHANLDDLFGDEADLFRRRHIDRQGDLIVQ